MKHSKKVTRSTSFVDDKLWLVPDNYSRIQARDDLINRKEIIYNLRQSAAYEYKIRDSYIFVIITMSLSLLVCLSIVLLGIFFVYSYVTDPEFATEENRQFIRNFWLLFVIPLTCGAPFIIYALKDELALRHVAQAASKPDALYTVLKRFGELTVGQVVSVQRFTEGTVRLTYRYSYKDDEHTVRYTTFAGVERHIEPGMNIAVLTWKGRVSCLV